MRLNIGYIFINCVAIVNHNWRYATADSKYGLLIKDWQYYSWRNDWVCKTYFNFLLSLLKIIGLQREVKDKSGFWIKRVFCVDLICKPWNSSHLEPFAIASFKFVRRASVSLKFMYLLCLWPSEYLSLLQKRRTSMCLPQICACAKRNVKT